MTIRLASTVASWVDGMLDGPDCFWSGISTIHQAGANDLAYWEGSGEPQTHAGVLICRQVVAGRTCVIVDDPKRTMIAVLNQVFPSDWDPGIHETAVVHSSAEVSELATIGPYVVIGADCQVGAGSVLHPHVVLYAGTHIGEQVVVHAGTVLGADGFSYHPVSNGLLKVPQVGRVEIANGVEIGANSCIDRAFLEATRIGKGAKIDNLVQVGHNSQVGAHAVLAAQTGLSGSVSVGAGALLGGQVGVADHVSVGARSQIGAKSGISRDVKPGQVLLGKVPAQPAPTFRRVVGAMRKLPELWTRLRRLEARMDQLEKEFVASSADEPQ